MDEASGDSASTQGMERFVRNWVQRHRWCRPEVVDAAASALCESAGPSDLIQALRESGAIKPRQAHEVADARRVAARLPRYRLLDKLGAGGVGAVYLARDRVSEEAVAIKVLHSELAGRKDQLTRFEREAGALAAMNHPAIPQLIDHGYHDGMAFLVQEFIRGVTLTRLYDRVGPLPEAYMLWIAVQVAHALDHAQRHAGLIHRDVKPQNVIIQVDQDAPYERWLTQRWPIKVIDFGLVRSDEIDSALTMTGVVLGTPRYMAPEQINAEPLDWRADQYALGASMFRLLTGHPVVAGDTPAAQMAAHLTEPVPDPQQYRSELHRPVCAIVMRCLAKQREDRFPSWSAFVEACDAALSRLTRTHHKSPVDGTTKRWRRVLRAQQQERASGPGLAALTPCEPTPADPAGPTPSTVAQRRRLRPVEVLADYDIPDDIDLIRKRQEIDASTNRYLRAGLATGPGFLPLAIFVIVFLGACVYAAYELGLIG
ncbi:MAG: serine/threonine-protein kinase [Planctomycetota bacterium]